MTNSASKENRSSTNRCENNLHCNNNNIFTLKQFNLTSIREITETDTSAPADTRSASATDNEHKSPDHQDSSECPQDPAPHQRKPSFFLSRRCITDTENSEEDESDSTQSHVESESPKSQEAQRCDKRLEPLPIEYTENVEEMKTPMALKKTIFKERFCTHTEMDFHNIMDFDVKTPCASAPALESRLEMTATVAVIQRWWRCHQHKISKRRRSQKSCKQIDCISETNDHSRSPDTTSANTKKTSRPEVSAEPAERVRTGDPRPRPGPCCIVM